ncbi:hypothetical protein EXIGLDRAFT_833047 [Exidia glandulosa HHB12029]|uniref:F-box domain-containing protein n=1 Tax=Exidia glandulosa HHB12029 TaxID=1314781 RepID=A0A165L185_EXIGL|nr:hypothetical protein EXIGLDRAFT_833047 [Exidia glandulosa HHB12029]
MLDDIVRNLIEAKLAQCIDAGDAENAVQSILRDVHRVLRQATRKWNNGNSDAWFPPELLSTCFSFLPSSELARLMFVSKRWRSIIISEPTFWTRVALTPRSDTTFFHELVRRAGALPLHLTVRGTTPVAELHAYFDRIASLIVYEGFNVPGLEDVLTSSLPRLRSLGLYGRCGAGFERDTITLEIPRTFLSSHPLLQSLHVGVFVLPTACPALRELRDFVGRIDVNNVLTSNIRLLFDLCPKLEALTLGINLRSGDGDLPLLPLRPLPSLSHLALNVPEYIDLAVHLRPIDAHAISHIRVEDFWLGPSTQNFLMEIRSPFNRVSVIAVYVDDIGVDTIDIRIEESPGDDKYVEIAYIGDHYFDDVVPRLRGHPCFENIAILTISHIYISRLFSGSCPALHALQNLEVVAPQLVSSDRTSDLFVGPDGRDLSYSWTDRPELRRFFDMPKRLHRPERYSGPVYRLPALKYLTIKAVLPPAHSDDGEIPYLRLQALCSFLDQHIDPRTPPISRSFSLQNIYIAEDIDSPFFAELSRLFDGIAYSNVCCSALSVGDAATVDGPGQQ